MCGSWWGWLVGGLLLWRFVVLFRGCMGGGWELGGRELGMGKGGGGCGVG